MHKKICTIILILIIVGTILLPLLVYAKTSNKTKEDFANVIFFAYFKGDTEGKEYLINNFNKFKNMYDGAGELTVKGYLDKVSYSQFNLINIFPQYNGNTLVPVELPCTSEGLENTNLDYTIIKSVIEAVPGISEKLDYNNDGFIDNVSIILKGGSSEADSNSTLVNHKSDYAESDTWSGKRLGTYNMLSTYGIENSGAGVITHEFMHSLGYPDLYTLDGSYYPVYTWDIMGSVNKQMSYPLAYMRMKFSNWLSIDTITTSQTLTLNTQDNPNGNQAYILKSPLNEYELFVVEFRKKATDLEHIDRLIGDSGIIVYRINTTVTGLSNVHGKTGVYVFREDENANDESSKRVAVYNAMYSKELGKTTIGVSDLNITKGALTFSDGTNSGIVISNISSSKGNEMTLDVSIPSANEYDTWKNTNFKDEVGGDSYTKKSANIIAYNNKIYTATLGNSKIYTQIYDGENWSTINTTTIENTNNITKVELLSIKQQLYLIATEWEQIKLYKFVNGKWESVTTLSDTNGLNDYKVYKDELYLSKVDYDGKNVSLYKLDNNKFIDLGTYYSGGEYAGSPKVESINENLYGINNQADGIIRMYKKEGNNFKEIETGMNANQYDIVSQNNKMYFVLGSDANNKNMRIVIYDGEKFETINTDINLGAPRVTVSQGNIYVLATDMSASGKTIVYAYDENTKKLTKEGVDVDNAADFNSLNLVSESDKIYVLLKRSTDGNIVVKEKQTVNSLKSITIIPPKKTTYIVGENLELEGMQVFANYVKEQKEVTNYEVTGFNSNKAGEYKATVTYEGISNTFTYTVVQKATEYKTLKEYLTDAGYNVSGEYVSGFTVGEEVSKIKTKIKNSNIQIKQNKELISTGTEFSYNGEKYIAVLYGDIDGDGKINSLDLLKMRQYLIRKIDLKGANKKAAEIANKTTINSLDLLKLRRHLLKLETIKQ